MKTVVVTRGAGFIGSALIRMPLRERSIDGLAEFLKTNVVGTFTLLEETVRYWQRLASAEQERFRFVHFSTDEVCCPNNYAPYQFPEKLIPLMIQNALKGTTLPVYGRGDVRDWRLGLGAAR